MGLRHKRARHLNAHLGSTFLKSIGDKHSVNCHRILYTTQDGVLLAKAARSWFREHCGQEITTAGYILHQIKEPLLRQVGQAETHSPSKQQRVKLMAKMAIAAHVAEEDSSSSEDHQHSQQSTSPDTSDTEITARNIGRMDTIVNKRHPILKQEVDSSATDYTRAAKRRRKGEKTKEEVEDDVISRGGPSQKR